MSKSSLELLFDYLEKDTSTGIDSILPKANEHYDDVLKQLENLSSSQSVRFTPFYIETILHHCEGSRFPKAKSYVENGRKEFERIVGILSNKNHVVNDSTSQITKTTPISNYRSYVEEQLPDHEPETRTEQKSSISESSFGQEKNQIPNTHKPTEYNDVWNKEKVRKLFKQLYDEVWSAAHEDLQRKLTDERAIAKVLLSILEQAFSYTKTESKKQIMCMMDALSDVTTSSQRGKTVRDEHAVDDYLLQRFRIAHAGLTVPRLQTEFVKTDLPDVLPRLYGRTRQPSVELRRYAREAVEVTWWMNVQTPPMMILDDKHDISKYTPIIRRASNKIDYIVWPALLRSINGPLLEKGIAVFM